MPSFDATGLSNTAVAAEVLVNLAFSSPSTVKAVVSDINDNAIVREGTGVGRNHFFGELMIMETFRRQRSNYGSILDRCQPSAFLKRHYSLLSRKRVSKDEVNSENELVQRNQQKKKKQLISSPVSSSYANESASVWIDSGTFSSTFMEGGDYKNIPKSAEKVIEHQVSLCPDKDEHREQNHHCRENDTQNKIIIEDKTQRETNDKIGEEDDEEHEEDDDEEEDDEDEDAILSIKRRNFKRGGSRTELQKKRNIFTSCQRPQCPLCEKGIMSFLEPYKWDKRLNFEKLGWREKGIAVMRFLDQSNQRKDWYNLKRDIYPILEQHAEMFMGRSFKRSRKRQLQDALSHNKAHFVSGKDEKQMNGYWRLRQMGENFPTDQRRKKPILKRIFKLKNPIRFQSSMITLESFNIQPNILERNNAYATESS